MFRLALLLWNLFPWAHSQCPTAFYSYDDQFCELSFDSYKQSCTSIDDIYSSYSYGLAMDPLNGEIYMAVSIDPEDEYSERAIIKFNQSSPNDYTVISRYSQSNFMAGLTFGGCDYNAATDEYSSTLYAISGVYATDDNETIIWKVGKTTGEMTTFVEIGDWHRHGRAIAYSPFVDKLYLIDCLSTSYTYSCRDVWGLLELDPNDDRFVDINDTEGNEVTRISSGELDVVAAIASNEMGNGNGRYHSFGVYNESHILVVSYDSIFLVDISEHYANATCVGKIDQHGIKGFVCQDMLQDYQNFAMCPNTTMPKLESDTADFQVCTEFTPAYDSSGSSDTPVGWIIFLIATIFICLFAIYKNDYIGIWCGRNKSFVVPDAAIEMHDKQRVEDEVR